MLNTGMYRDQTGKKVIETETADALWKMAGFQPNDVAQVQQASRSVQQMIALNKLVESEIAGKMAQARFERSQDKMDAAREDLDAWNRNNPESRIQISASQINKRVQEMNRSKAQRMARTAPKEIRATVRSELAGV